MVKLRACRGHTMIELVMASALGGLVLVATLEWHAQQRSTWRATLEAVDALARASEALRVIELATRGAVEIRVTDTGSAAGHRLTLDYGPVAAGRAEHARMMGPCVGRSGGTGPVNGKASPAGGRRLISQWFVRVAGAMANEIDEGTDAEELPGLPVTPRLASGRADEDARSELYCARGEDGNASPIVSGIGTLSARWRPGRTTQSRSTVDLCVIPAWIHKAPGPMRDSPSIASREACGWPTGNARNQGGFGEGLGLSTRVALRSRVVALPHISSR